MSDTPLMRYLLGLLPEEETERLDALSIADGDFAWQLKAVENDMVDAYVRDELQGEILDRFRSEYLASARKRQKVEFASALVSVTRDNAPPRRQGWFSAAMTIPRWVLACGLGLALVVAGVLSYGVLSHGVLSVNQRRVVISQSPPSAGSTLAVLLAPPTRSATRPPVVQLPAGTARVALDMQLEADDFPLYRVALKGLSGGQIIWRSEELKAQARDGRAAVTMVLPARILQSGRYVLELASGGAQSEVIGNYVFDVVKM